jgi:hypothetical protein
LAVTVDPDVVWVAFQIWLIASPLVNVHLTVHPDRAAVDELLRTVTPAWNPAPHEDATAYVALQAPVPGLDGGALDGGALDGGRLDGGWLEGAWLDGGTLDGGALVGPPLPQQPGPMPVTWPVPPSKSTSEQP